MSNLASSKPRVVILFSAMLAHAGNIMHTVHVEEVSEAELRILRHIHGAGSLSNVREIGSVERNEREELLRLARKYNVPTVEKVFGVTLDEFDSWLEETLAAEQQAITDRAAAREDNLRVDMARAAAEASKSAAKTAAA